MELVARDANWKARMQVSSPTPVNEAATGSFLFWFSLDDFKGQKSLVL